MFWKTFIIFFFSFFLFSCWETDDISTNSWLSLFENSYFSISIPWTWNIIQNDDNVLPKPKNWDITLAVSSTQIKYWFANNLLVLKQWLDKKTTSRDFSIINNVWASWEYNNYVLLETQDIWLWDSDSTKVFTFEAKYNEVTPMLKFVQTSVVCWNDWFLLTIALALDTEWTSKYVDIFKTFRCK